MNFEELLENLLDPKFDIKQLDFNQSAVIAAHIMNTKETNQKVLGRLAAGLEGKYGDKVIEKLANSIKENTGFKISPSTLRGYRWVYQRVGYLNVPADFPFHTWKTLASTPNPQEWIDKALAQGWSGSQLVREIKVASGKTAPPKQCPQCGYVYESQN